LILSGEVSLQVENEAKKSELVTITRELTNEFKRDTLRDP
jgi:hypothetical protein